MTEADHAEKIGFAAIIFWDFVEISNEEELLTTLEEVYGAKPEEYGGMTLGGSGGWSHWVAGNQENDIEESEEFESVRTVVQSETKGIFDVTTYAVLSEEQIQSIFVSGNTRRIEKLQSKLAEHLAELPTLVDYGDTGHSGAYYAEWAGEDSLVPDADGTDTSEIMERLAGELATLSGVGFQIGGLLSLIKGSVFVCPRMLMQPFDGFAVVRRDQHPDSEPFDDLIFPPGWAAELDQLRRYYRLKIWTDSRWTRLQQFDTRAQNAREELLSLSSSQIDVDEVLPVSEQIQGLQIEYTEFRTRFETEFRSLQEQLSGGIEDDPVIDVPYDVAISASNSPVVEMDEHSRSVIEYFQNNAEKTFEQIDDRRELVSNKIDSLVASIESRTRLAATDENLELQNRVTSLTWVLILLTVFLVILTVVLVALEIV